MPSDFLYQTQKTANKQAQVAAKAQKALYRLHENTFYSNEQRAVKIADEVALAKSELALLEAQSAVNHAGIQERVRKRRVPATVEAKAMVKERIANGWTFDDLLQHLKSQEDRAGVSALVDYLPDLARMKKLPGDTDHTTFDEQVNHAKGAIAVAEEKLFDSQERQLQYELKEFEINGPLMAQNKTIVEKWLDDAARVPENVRKPIDRMYRWSGMPPTHVAYDGRRQGFASASELLNEADNE